MIYLDNAATTRISPKVLATMMPYLKEDYGNPGAIYSCGRKAAEAVKIARGQVAKMIGAEEEQIIFTSGGTEANNMVFHGVKEYLKSIGKTRILVSAVEHKSVLEAAQNLIKDGFDIVFLPVKPNGEVNMDILKELLTKDVGLVSVMYVNNEVGAVNPVHEIGAICREVGVLFHTDCVQATGCNPINVKQLGCDFLSLSGHKIYAPKGIGGLFIRNKDLFNSMISGGSTQEFGLRGGTENVPNIVGFGEACRLFGDANIVSACGIIFKEMFYWKLIECLKSEHLDNIVSINGADLEEENKVLNLRFENIDGETLVIMLDTYDVCISAGSACQSHESNPSHVLVAMGLSPEEARESVRISFSIFNTPSEVLHAAEIMAHCVASLYQAK